jgi:hypothetical protein
MKHLTSHYSADESRLAEVHRLDDGTYVVYLFENSERKHHVYYDLMDDAEDRAEEFVLAVE